MRRWGGRTSRAIPAVDKATHAGCAVASIAARQVSKPSPISTVSAAGPSRSAPPAIGPIDTRSQRCQFGGRLPGLGSQCWAARAHHRSAVRRGAVSARVGPSLYPWREAVYHRRPLSLTTSAGVAVPALSAAAKRPDTGSAVARTMSTARST